jgi:hypothetical protein
VSICVFKRHFFPYPFAAVCPGKTAKDESAFSYRIADVPHFHKVYSQFKPAGTLSRELSPPCTFFIRSYQSFQDCKQKIKEE